MNSIYKILPVAKKNIHLQLIVNVILSHVMKDKFQELTLRRLENKKKKYTCKQKNICEGSSQHKEKCHCDTSNSFCQRKDQR
ncbi:hypothetical protein V1478_014913 [Vespula squamosa]|uniref:Uncharacterized protein n=1 Tax=Vespula squamosa TaxID=30214 RepID=A0ABD2A3L0_VESSQ